jgi:hypothetical protein
VTPTLVKRSGRIVTNPRLDVLATFAVVSFFALIHIPVEEQPEILRRVSAWLVPGGLFLATVGHHRWTGIGDFYGADMYWSQADASTYCAWLSDVGIDVVAREFVAEEPYDGHELILGVRQTGARENATRSHEMPDPR